MKIQFNLSQTSKNTRIISSVEYSFEGNNKLDYGKLSDSITNVVFRKLDKQTNTGVSFGIKVSKAFNLVVIADDIQILNLEKVFMSVTDKGKLKINNKLYKDDRSKAKEQFNTMLYAILEEYYDSQLDFSNCFETE